LKRHPLKQLLINYKNNHSDEKSLIEASIQFLESTPQCFNRNNLNGHFTGSSWIVDETREWVLMTHHRKLDLWLQLGGHADGCSDLLKVALSEAREESGFNVFNVLSPDIFDLGIHRIPKYNNTPAHFHYDVRFILESPHGTENIIVSDESHDVAWVHKDNVINKNPEESMARMLKKMSVNFSL
jgi:8-oxo-dGTP pyrophosphatase MutT (NUDIX family)|tara:strand:- start:1369 stop:1920 length:552 start_codon:yes stop_codon:yes gene_type:complete